MVKEPSMHTLEEQTRASWAKVVAHLDEVPEAFRDFLKAQLGDTSPWPYTILLPTYEGFMKQENA